ncbi:MAG TPA: CPBP family intramembrane glutamic endopeptidase [Candidatus Eisenbacteria bacterium]|nr:CPBP family intramembrane glutamic endopeptidase [Candidatus Eisenbacteria bacterium]
MVIPWRGHARLQKLLAMPAVDAKEKLALYGATIGFQWVLCAVVAWRAIARGLTVQELGLNSTSWLAVTIGVGGGLLIGGLQWMNLRRIGKMEGPVTDRMRNLAKHLFPVSWVEYLPYAALAITAGVCEEFIYRGFVLGAFRNTPMATWLAVILSSGLFGLAHAYQGRAGIFSTGMFGVLLALARLGLGSLVPVMIWHAGLDLAAGIAGPKYLLPAADEPIGMEGK